MTWLPSRATPGGVAGTLALLTCLALPAIAGAQNTTPLRTFPLPMDQPAVAVIMPEGGSLRVSGSVVYGVDGTVFDAASATAAGGARREGGIVDPAAGGLALGEQDPSAHVYTYHASGTPGAACQAILLGNTCVVLRLPQIAAERLQDLDEVREELTGNMRVEVFGPPVGGFDNSGVVVAPVGMPPSMPGSGARRSPTVPMWVWAVGGASTSGLIIALLVIAVATRRRKATTPLARAQAAAARLRKRLASDTVRARLLQLVEDLATEAASLAAMEQRLDRAVHDAKPEGIERRRDELKRQAEGLEQRGGAEAGQGELDGAVKILEDQLERCRRWEMQRWRSAARLERIATRLEALEVELNDPTAGQQGTENRLLDALQEELDLARAGEQEAQRLLKGDSEEGH